MAIKDRLMMLASSRLFSFYNKQLKQLAVHFLTLTCALFFSPVFAQNTPNPCPWIFTGNLGYGQYQDMFKDDGRTAIGRFAVGKEFFKSDEMAFGSEIALGLELGVQTGNSMRLEVPQVTLNLLGGLPIQSTLKPSLDVLMTLRTNTLENAPLFMQLKAGVMYRQWQFENRDSINTLSKAAPELQLGIGYLISDMAFATLSYQGVFGGKPDFTVNRVYHTGEVANIPSQNAILLGLSLTV